MSNTRDFTLDDVLTATTGRLVSRRHIEAMYDLLSFMTGYDLFTHQLGRACEQVKPIILNQHPWLADVEVPDEFRDENHVWAWLADQEALYPNIITLTAIPEAVSHVDPLTELVQMRGGADGIIPVVVD